MKWFLGLVCGLILVILVNMLFPDKEDTNKAFWFGILLWALIVVSNYWMK